MTVVEELYSVYYKDVYRYLFSLCRDASLTEDLASETFLEVVKSISTFRADCDVRTWLFTIARRRWLNRLRKKKRTVETTDIFELTELEQPGGSSPEEDYLRRELAGRVMSIINAEPERQRKTALMRVEGYSYYEIGKALGISENSARVMFFRTREKIRKILKEEGYDYE